MNYKAFGFLLLLSLILFSCSENKYPGIDDIAEINPQEIVSANGIFMAKSVEDLKEIIRPSVDGLLGRDIEFTISSYEFLETNTATAIMIDIATENGLSNRVMYVKEYSLSRVAADKCYTITCSADCNCSPKGTINSANVSLTCTGDCSCSMTIKEHDCSKH